MLEIIEPLARMLAVFTFGKVIIKSSIYYFKTTDFKRGCKFGSVVATIHIIL